VDKIRPKRDHGRGPRPVLCRKRPQRQSRRRRAGPSGLPDFLEFQPAYPTGYIMMEYIGDTGHLLSEGGQKNQLFPVGRC
jgi:hypothetical protein